MRPTALLPALCCAAALVLSFLCLFAGHKKSFMQSYDVLSLNVSRLGEGLVNGTLEGSDGVVGDLWDLVPDSIQGDIGEAAGKVVDKLGIQDFYSAHLLDYCYGEYVPTDMPNATVPAKDIHRNVTGCSNRTAMYWFDPTAILSHALNASGVNVTLQDLEWPQDIQHGLDALRLVSVTAFVLYCIAIGLVFLSFLAALPAVFAEGRLAACVNVLLATLGFLAFGLASALVTAVAVKGVDVVNKHGRRVGVEAKRGNKFLALTWAGTGIMFLVVIMWTVEVCVGRKRKAYVGGKHG